MKAQCLTAFVVLLISPLFIRAQCAAASQQTLVRDSTITGYGNAYDPPYTFTFPKFDTTLGKLASVNIKSTVSVNFTFSYENEDTIARSVPQQRVYRSDYVSSTVLPADLTSDLVYPGNPKFGPYPVAKADGVASSGADYISVGPTTLLTNSTIINSTIADSTKSKFTGAGNISFAYSTYTYAGPVITKFTYRSVASETVHFAVSYTYCPLSVLTPLAQDILSFAASKNNDEQVYLQWLAANEAANHFYVLEKSNDGINFIAVDNIDALFTNGQPANYSYTYNPLPDESKLYFRIKEQDKNGSWKYSGIQRISFQKKTGKGISIYPNPGNGPTMLVFNGAQENDWDVTVLSVRGELLQHLQFNKTSRATLDLKGRLSRGVYFIKALNRQTQQQFMERLLIP